MSALQHERCVELEDECHELRMAGYAKDAELLALRARCEKLEAAVREIGGQRLLAEMGDDAVGADFETGYDECIKVARAALEPPQ